MRKLFLFYSAISRTHSLLFGGATLVLFYDSKRHSGDLDLLSLIKQPPSPEKLIEALKDPLTEVAEALNLAPIQIEILQNSGDVNKLAVLRETREVLFTIDITKMSAVIQSELVHEPIPDEETVVTHPSRNLLLLHKAEAFLTRKKVKARDAFDIKLLSDSGGKLDDNLRIHLIDGPASDRLEAPEYIEERIEAVTPKLCETELKPFVTAEIYEELSAKDFEPLRSALRSLFREWL